MQTKTETKEAAATMLKQLHSVIGSPEALSLICLQQGFEALDEPIQQEIRDQVDCLQVAIDMMHSKEDAIDFE